MEIARRETVRRVSAEENVPRETEADDRETDMTGTVRKIIRIPDRAHHTVREVRAAGEAARTVRASREEG